MAVRRTEKLLVELAADVRDLKKGLTVAQGDVTKFEKSTGRSTGAIKKFFSDVRFPTFGAAAIAASVGLLAKFTNAAVNSADQIAKSAKAAGVASGAYQELSHAAGLAGISQDQLDVGLKKLSLNIGKAGAGVDKQVQLFRDLKLSVGPTEVVLGQLADRLKDMPTHAERMRVATELLGREAGPRFIEMLAGGNAELEKMRQEARSLGLVLSDDILENMEAVNDKLETQQKIIAVHLNKALLELTPLLVGSAQAFAELAPFISAASRELAVFFGLAERPAREKLQAMNAQLAPLQHELNRRRSGQGSSPAFRHLSDKGVEDELNRMREHQAPYRPALERQAGLDAERVAEAAKARETKLKTGITDPDDIEANEEKKKAIKDLEDYRKRMQEDRLAGERKVHEHEMRHIEELARQEKEYQDRMASDRVAAEDKIHDFEMKYIEERAEQQRDQLEEMRENVRTFSEDAAQSFTDMFMSGELSARKFGDVLKRMLLEIAAQQLIMKPLSGMISGAIKGFASGWSANGGWGNLFGSGAVRDAGGPVSAGQSYMIGLNRRPEMFTPRTSGTITPLAPAGAVGGSGPRVKVEVSIEPGMQATQERQSSSSPGGMDTIRLMVRSMVQDEVSRRGPLSNSINQATGTRRPPKAGVS